MKDKAAFIASVGSDLKRDRLKLGLTKTQVADAIGVTSVSIANWEAGRGMMSAYSRERLRGFFRAKWAEREQQVTEEKARTAQGIAQ